MRILDTADLADVSGGEMSTKTKVVIGIIGAISPLGGIVALASYYINSDQDSCD